MVTNLKKLILIAVLGVWALGLVGCGSGGGRTRFVAVVIVHNGHYGYYYDNLWCDYLNNYCGSGDAWGIGGTYGCYYDGLYCDSYYSGNYWYNSPTNNGGGNGGGYYNGGTNNGGGNGGGYDNGYNNGGGNGYNNGGYNNGGYNNGGYNNGANYDNGNGWNNGGWNNSNSGNNSNWNSGNNGNNGNSWNNGNNGFNIGGATSDTDLQRAQLQSADREAKAQSFAAQFQMSIESARQLSQLADKMNELSVQGQMTDKDRMALADSALGVTGISSAEVTAAMTKMASGDKSAVDGLVSKAATHLGMPSTAALRDQLLPSLGIVLK